MTTYPNPACIRRPSARFADSNILAAIRRQQARRVARPLLAVMLALLLCAGSLGLIAASAVRNANYRPIAIAEAQ